VLDEDTIAPVSRRVILAVLSVIALAVSTPVGTAGAHSDVGAPRPTSGVLDSPAPASGEHESTSPAHHPALAHDHAPSALAFVAGALAILAAFPNRRRTLAVALALAVTAVALEGATHAALHLGHVDHARSLAIDASAQPPAVVDLGAGAPRVAGPTPIDDVPLRRDTPVTAAPVAAACQRAPPLLATL
jgi:hypothetical protein